MTRKLGGTDFELSETMELGSAIYKSTDAGPQVSRAYLEANKSMLAIKQVDFGQHDSLDF